jgi:hypothetical protein
MMAVTVRLYMPLEKAIQVRILSVAQANVAKLAKATAGRLTAIEVEGEKQMNKRMRLSGRPDTACVYMHSLAKAALAGETPASPAILG